MRRSVSLYTILSVFCGLMTGCSGAETSTDRGPAQAEATEGVGTTKSAMENANPWNAASPGFAAVYVLRDSGSWDLCSGTVVQRLWGWSGILTARQCVTGDGTSYGTVVSSDRVRISVSNAPGFPNPPGDALDSNYISAPSPVFDAAHNVAMIWVAAEVPIGVERFGLYLGDNDGLPGKRFVSWAYGDSPAGYLRYGSMFQISGVSHGAPTDYAAFSFTNSSNSAWFADHDNGAAALEWQGQGHPVILGLVTGTEYGYGASIGGPAAAGFAKFVQDETWFFYLSPLASVSYNVGAYISPPGSGGWLYGRHYGDNEMVRLNYLPNTREIRFWGTDLCLEPLIGWVGIRTCNGTDAQKWNIHEYMIRNVASDLCLRDDGEWPVTGACDGTDQAKWIWHAQP